MTRHWVSFKWVDLELPALSFTFSSDKATENSILPWRRRRHERSASAEKSVCSWSGDRGIQSLKTNPMNTWLLKHSVLFPNVVVILCLVGFEKSVLPPPQCQRLKSPPHRQASSLCSWASVSCYKIRAEITDVSHHYLFSIDLFCFIYLFIYF